jgi:hypothetical protein
VPEYKVTFPRAETGPAVFTAWAASREKAERAAAELYRYETKGREPGQPKTIPVYGPITQEN